MRLDKKTLQAIKDVFKNKEIYLFGSRTNDNSKGGDIDLFINEDLTLSEIRKLKIELMLKIGIQKIDIVSKNYANEILKEEVLKNGILINNRKTEIK